MTKQELQITKWKNVGQNVIPTVLYQGALNQDGSRLLMIDLVTVVGACLNFN